MQQHTEEGYVRSELRNQVAIIEFHHPQSNSLPGKILEALASAIHGAGNDAEAKVILLRSYGEKAFCAGASFEELMAIRTEAEGHAFFSGFAHVINAMRTCNKFVVARIHGKCVGGGVGIAAAADYAIAVNSASVKLSELAVGIGPFVVGPAVERKIGQAAFSQLSIDAASWRSASWAYKKGLFAEVYETEQGMDEAIDRLTATLAHSNPEAMTVLKQVFWSGTEHWQKLLYERAAISGKLVLSAFTRQAIEKFKKK